MLKSWIVPSLQMLTFEQYFPMVLFEIRRFTNENFRKSTKFLFHICLALKNPTENSSTSSAFKQTTGIHIWRFHCIVVQWNILELCHKLWNKPRYVIDIALLHSKNNRLGGNSVEYQNNISCVRFAKYGDENVYWGIITLSVVVQSHITKSVEISQFDIVFKNNLLTLIKYYIFTLWNTFNDCSNTENLVMYSNLLRLRFREF